MAKEKFIVIPTAGRTVENKKRVDRAVEEGTYTPLDTRVIYLINGGIVQPASTSQVKQIYRRLIAHGVEKRNIRLEGRSVNSIENVLFGHARLETMGASEAWRASYKEHLERLDYVENLASRENYFNQEIKMHRLESPATLGEHIYGIASTFLYWYRFRNGLKNAKKPWFHEPVKKVLDFAVRIFN